jgi:hypothetical protein
MIVANKLLRYNKVGLGAVKSHVVWLTDAISNQPWSSSISCLCRPFITSPCYFNELVWWFEAFNIPDYYCCYCWSMATWIRFPPFSALNYVNSLLTLTSGMTKAWASLGYWCSTARCKLLRINIMTFPKDRVTCSLLNWPNCCAWESSEVNQLTLPTTLCHVIPLHVAGSLASTCPSLYAASYLMRYARSKPK